MAFAKRKPNGCIDFAGMVQTGENPNGVVMQNSNGTIFDGAGGDGRQWNYGQDVSGSRWNSNPLAVSPGDAGWGEKPNHLAVKNVPGRKTR